MELSSTEWLSQPEMQDPTSMKQYGMGSFDCSFDELNFQSVSAESYSSYPDLNPKSTYDCNGLDIENTRITGDLKRPAKQLKTSSWNSCTTDLITSMAASSSSQIICFENRSSAPPNLHQIYDLDCTVKAKNESLSDRNMNFPTSISESSFEMQNCTPAHDRVPDTTTRTSLRVQDHVMAERKRREKLSQRFIALSTILPSLKKMDKASVLGDAIKYLKQLQERVNILEEQAAKKTMESVIFVKKTRLSADDGTSSHDENSDQQLPEIEARVSDKNVLLRVHCEKSKGCISKILSEIEKLDLNIVNSSILPFGNSTIDITVVAQMDVEFRMTPKDLVRNLRQALQGLMK